MFKNLRQLLIRRYFNLTMADPFVIVQVDGGICSQMCQYVIGRIMGDKDCHVKYDVTWYDENGLDDDGNFIRNFDLLTAFPELKFEKATVAEVTEYKRRFFYNPGRYGRGYRRQIPPVYFGGHHYNVREYLTDEYFQKLFKFDEYTLSAEDKKVLSAILAHENSVGIHVRRGDLSNARRFWVPLSIDYFVTAVINYQESYPDTKFFFFSDEIDWVQKEIVPNLDKNINFQLVSHNGSDKGYVDLFLLSKCRHIVGSQGGLGRYAALLNEHPNKTLTVHISTVPIIASRVEKLPKYVRVIGTN